VDGWWDALAQTNAFRTLDIKLRSTTKSMKCCSQKFIGRVRFQLAVIKEVVLILEQAHDLCPLLTAETELQTELKFK
jgi:hypothetical protein